MFAIHRTLRQVAKRGAIAAALIAFATGSSAQASDQGVTDDEITIGALGALTGATAFIGGPGRDGIQLAVDQINEAGGIEGRKLNLVFEHAFTPAESVAAAKKLVQSDKVFVLILASGSTGAAAAADFVRETGVPTYNIFGATPIIRQPFADNVFHSAIPGAEVSGQAMIDRALEAKPDAKKIGLLAGTYAFPQANKKAILPLLEALDVEVVVEEFDQGSRDFTSQLLSFARQRVDAVLILGSFAEAGFAIKQGPEKGLTDATWVVDGSAVNDAIVPILGDENTKNVWGYFNAPYFPGQSDPPIAAFKEAWIAKYGEPPQGRPNLYDLVGYGSTYVLAEAMKNAGRDLTWDSLIAAWSGLQNSQPSNLGGVDVIFAQSFSETDHQGSTTLGKAAIRDGIWQVIDR